MSQISKKVRDAVRLKLSDSASGFNPVFASVAPTYGVNAFTVDFSERSPQFFQAFVHPDEIDESTPSKYPLMCLYTLRCVNRNEQKFSLFSGDVLIGIDVHLTWRNARVLPDFESLADAVEEAVITLFNDDALITPPSVAYNGGISLDRSTVTMAGEHWRKTLSFRLAFEVHTN